MSEVSCLQPTGWSPIFVSKVLLEHSPDRVFLCVMAVFMLNGRTESCKADCVAHRPE